MGAPHADLSALARPDSSVNRWKRSRLGANENAMPSSVTTIPQASERGDITSEDWRVRRGRGSRAWTFVALAAALLAATAVALFLRGLEAPSPPAAIAQMELLPVLSVTVAPAEIRPMTRSVAGDGSVVAWQEIAIAAEVSGLRAVEIAADEGDRVHRGQLLVRFDNSVLAAQVAQVDAAIAESEAALQTARSDFSRGTELIRSGSIASQVLEQRQSAARQAEARVLAARAHREEVVARLAQARLLAPADGVVVRRSVQLGAVSAEGQEMFRLVRDGRLELDAKIPELELAAVHPGQVVRVVHGGWEAQATVRAIAPMIAADTRLGVVHIALPTDSPLRPGMFARAEIRLDTAPTLVVAQTAIVFRDDAPAVFVQHVDNSVSLRRLTTGVRRDGLVEVLGGLQAGELVVTAGAGFLSDGDRVRVVPALAIAAH
jgi:RND family efflux transporter MFP subunit